MLHALAQLDVSGRDLAALRVAVSGGSSLPEDVMRTFEGKYGIEVLEGYGLSETGSTSSFNRPGDRKPLSVGKPIWGVQMRVADNSDQPLPPGSDQIGEIQIRGHNVMKGYRNRPEATASALAGGWLHTGDLGYVDEDGFYFIVDRTKDLVIRGGYNVYPREIEEVLFAHPGILEAAVIGKPDDRLGEEVVAVVVLHAGVEPRRARDHRVLPGAAGGLQVPARGQVPRRAAQGPDGQDSQDRAARRVTGPWPAAAVRAQRHRPHRAYHCAGQAVPFQRA